MKWNLFLFGIDEEININSIFVINDFGFILILSGMCKCIKLKNICMGYLVSLKKS